jgi:hypothetical protein
LGIDDFEFRIGGKSSGSMNNIGDRRFAHPKPARLADVDWAEALPVENAFAQQSSRGVRTI